MPVWLAASHYHAKQLQRTCEYWMAVDVASWRNKQWNEVPAAVRDSVRAERARLQKRREELQAERLLMQQLPCVLLPKDIGRQTK